MPNEHSCVEFKIIFGLLFMMFAVFLSVWINFGYCTLDYFLFNISHRVFLVHFLLLLFILNEGSLF